MAVKITMTTNSAQTVKELDKVDKKIQKIQKENSIRQGVAKLNKDLDGLAGGTEFGRKVMDFTSKLGGLTRLLNPWAAAVTAAIAATTYLAKVVNERVEAGMETANTREKMTATLQGQLKSQGVLNVDSVVEELELMSENGVATVEELTRAFIKLVPVMKGNTREALEWTRRMADVQAATGLSAEQLTTAINQIKTTGNIEEEVAKKIPFWKALSEAMNQSIDDVKKLVQAHKVGSEDMLAALKKATDMYEGTAAAISSNTTEGAKSSMEAAKGRAMEPYAEGRNHVLRNWYMDEQADYDRKAGDPEWVEQALAMGTAAGEVEVAFQKLYKTVEQINDLILNSKAVRWLLGTDNPDKKSYTAEESQISLNDYEVELDDAIDKVLKGELATTSEETLQLINNFKDAVADLEKQQEEMGKLYTKLQEKERKLL